MNAGGAKSVRPPAYCRRQRAGVIVAVLCAGLVYASAVRADGVPCPERVSVTVAAADPQMACAAADEALAFLDANGLSTTEPIEISIVSRLPKEGVAEALGCYDQRDRQIHVLDLASCRSKGRILGLPVDAELHRSVIAHEVAHAAAAPRFAVARPGLAAQEYIACVAQISVLSEGTRARILERHPGTGFETTAEISSTIYLMDPNFFAAQAWRHFMKPENGAAFLRRLLAGELPPD